VGAGRRNECPAYDVAAFSGRKKYHEALSAAMNYINTYLIDHTYGEWYMEGLDKRLVQKPFPRRANGNQLP
jgi:mannose/cellobiose epimerase-like protein (N-acyl-D-glucosamine 2-epimerase family)